MNNTYPILKRTTNTTNTNNTYSDPNCRCPKCFNRSFFFSAVQSLGRPTIWICSNCGFDTQASLILDQTPKGCVSIINEKEVYQ